MSSSIQALILSVSAWKDESVRDFRFDGDEVRVERNLTKSLVLPLIMKVMMSRKLQPREKMSETWAGTSWVSLRVSAMEGTR